MSKVSDISAQDIYLVSSLFSDEDHETNIGKISDELSFTRSVPTSQRNQRDFRQRIFPFLLTFLNVKFCKNK